MDNFCARECHVAQTVFDMRHERRQSFADGIGKQTMLKIGLVALPLTADNDLPRGLFRESAEAIDVKGSIGVDGSSAGGLERAFEPPCAV